ncbi:hypothetical protein [Fructilactobacillus frigidiflavus]|uniref:hypothetical protein n=1 Tax=Fructilactobacillus frigidiflavus TaxID=3242688 RepID=UPI003756DA8E
MKKLKSFIKKPSILAAFYVVLWVGLYFVFDLVADFIKNMFGRNVQSIILASFLVLLLYVLAYSSIKGDKK